MFTKKPEAGDSVTKMGERLGGETYGAKSPNASKMIPSIIGEGLTITGNVASKGEIQVDGEIQGDIRKLWAASSPKTSSCADGWSARSRACALRSRRSPISKATLSIKASP
jgi:hypothetical protein